MESGGKVVVLVRVCGNVLACERKATGLQVRKVGTYTTPPPNQAQAFKLLRR